MSQTPARGSGHALDSEPTIGCASFEVKLAGRFGTQDKNNNAGLHEFTYTGFRFDQTESDGSNITNHPWAATRAELERLARWMNERKGGLFGTGDHHYLGARLCSRIPRLGIMRMRSVTDGVPPKRWSGGCAREWCAVYSSLPNTMSAR